MDTVTPTQQGTRRRLGWILTLLAFSHLIVSLDFTIVYVALPDIGREVGFSAHGLQWVISGFAIFYGGFVLLGGRMSDLIGRRRMLMLGMLLFGISSLVGGLATHPGQLVAARVIQGLGAAVLFPATLSLVNTTFAEGRDRNRALTWWALAGAGGLSVGALLGGVLTEVFGWPAVFFVNVPLAITGIVGALVLLPADPAARGNRVFDLPGAVAGTVGTTLLIFAVAQGPEIGWSSVSVLAAAVLAILLLAVFLRIEARSRQPLMPLRLFRNRNLSSAMLVILAFGMTMNTIIFFLTVHYQSVLGYGALQAGLAFLLLSTVIGAANILAGRLMERIGTRATLITGLTLGAAGAALLGAVMTADGAYLPMLPGILVYGLGMGLVYPSMFAAAGTGVAGHEQGTAGGMASTSLQVGIAAGLAVLVGISTAGLDGLSGEPLRSATADGLSAAVFVAAAGAALGILAALRLPGRRADARRPQPADSTAH